MTALDSNSPEIEVKLFYKACRIINVRADTREEAHKKAYNSFMDASPKAILESSEIEYDFVETTIDGEDGSDMLHD